MYQEVCFGYKKLITLTHKYYIYVGDYNDITVLPVT